MTTKRPDKEEDQYAQARRRMVARQLRGRDITDARVLEAMAKVPRHRFVPEATRRLAYQDGPLPIGHGQTISQPYIVALMTQIAEPKANERALDVGTGSGYQAAVLAELVESVYSIEIVEPLQTDQISMIEFLS
jgi:protein-L-isoaspartate(D-aspartate) O-methyltransferase